MLGQVSADVVNTLLRVKAISLYAAVGEKAHLVKK